MEISIGLKGLKVDHFLTSTVSWADPEGGGEGGQEAQRPGPPAPLKNHKNIGFLSNTGRIPEKATKPAFNVGPSSACQRNAISMVFRWWGDDGPILAVFGSTLIN